MFYKLASHPRARLLTHVCGVALFAIATLPIYYFGLVPGEEAVVTNQLRTGKLRKEMKGADLIRGEYRMLTGAIAGVEDSPLPSIEIPTAANDTQFLGHVSSIAAEHGITIDDFRIGDVKHQKRLSSLGVEIEFTANFTSICKFFDQVAALPQLSRLTHLEIAASNVPESYPVVAEFELCFFAAPEPDREIARNSASPAR